VELEVWVLFMSLGNGWGVAMRFTPEWALGAVSLLVEIFTSKMTGTQIA